MSICCKGKERHVINIDLYKNRSIAAKQTAWLSMRPTHLEFPNQRPKDNKKANNNESQPKSQHSNISQHPRDKSSNRDSSIFLPPYGNWDDLWRHAKISSIAWTTFCNMRETFWKVCERVRAISIRNRPNPFDLDNFFPINGVETLQETTCDYRRPAG